MKTFNNNKVLKQELIKKLQHHQDLDAFIQGTWLDINSDKVEGDTFKGCFYGCTMQTTQNPIEKFSEKYNIDLWYCYLTEKIFEGLPKGEYEKFPLESINVLPVGVDINEMRSLFHYRVLESQLQFCKSDEKVTNAILNCMELFKTPFDQIKESEAESASELAKSASESASESASWAAAAAEWSVRSEARAAASAAKSASSAAEAVSWSVAWSARVAAEAVMSAAESAAESAARAAAWSTSEQDYYVFMKDTLFTCIKETY